MSRRGARAALVALGAALVVALPGLARAQMLSPGPLSSAHQSLDGDNDCDSCHAQGKKVDDQKCLGCHDALASRLAKGAGLHGRQFKGQECERCHVEHIGRDAKLVRWPGGAPEKLDHDQTGYRLEGGHTGRACAACHTQKTRAGRTTFLGASPACVSCHKDKDPHAGRLGPECASCHVVRAWKEVTLDHFDHGRTRYPLAGKHAQVECKKCHGEPAKWSGLAFAACSDCHQDPHAGKFKRFACASCHSTDGWSELNGFRARHPGVSLAAGHARVACKTCHDAGNDRPPSKGNTCVACHAPVHRADFGRNCKTCHASIKWVDLPPEVGLAAHGRTRYPLEGKHAQVGCDDCHLPTLPEDQRFRGLDFARCTGCHADRHSGEFAARQGGDCAPCHGVGGFRPTRFGVQAHATTAYPLDGKHQAIPCSACHARPRPRLDLHLAGRACADCHADPHAGQFTAEMARGGCAVCHDASGWDRPRIDHSTWPLTGAHARTGCVPCHGKVAGEGQGPAENARYRGIPRDCEGCHADVHAGQFRLNQPVRACSGCHATETWKRAADYDHGKQTGWALAGKHAQLACAACHPSVRLADGSSAVRYRLGYRACRACHADPHTEAR